MNPSALKLAVLVTGGGRFATWDAPEIGKGSILMREGETLWRCFSRAMDEKRTQAAALIIQADRFRLFSIESYNRHLEAQEIESAKAFARVANRKGEAIK